MTKTLEELRVAHCAERDGKSALDAAAVKSQLAVLPAWSSDGKRIACTYKFGNYWETLAFVNALAYVVHREDHHPELVVGYDKVEVRFDTHSAGGITLNDFVCAAKADAIYAERPKTP